MRKYIKKYIKNIIREISQEKEIERDFSRFKILLDTTPPHIKFKLIQQDAAFRIVIKYLDENNYDLEYKIDIPNITELNITTLDDYKKYFQSDMEAITSIGMSMNFLYKNQTQHDYYNFTEYNRIYNPDILGEVFVEIQDWLKAYPEYLV